MSWIKKIFKNSKQQPEEKSLEDMSKMQVPVDEVFVENLKKNGGIFIYCESLTDIIETIGKIVAENIENIKLSCHNDMQYHVFKGQILDFLQIQMRKLHFF